MAGHRTGRMVIVGALLIFIYLTWFQKDPQNPKWLKRPRTGTKNSDGSGDSRGISSHETPQHYTATREGHTQQELSVQGYLVRKDNRRIVPASQVSSAVLQSELQRLLPNQTNVTKLLHKASPNPFWLDRKPVIAHRGIHGAIANGYTSEMSMRSLEAAVAAGATIIELDIMPLGAISPSQKFVLAHDRYSDRLVDRTGLWADFEPASIEDVAMHHVVKLVNRFGKYTGESYLTVDRVVTVKSVAEDFLPRHPGVNLIFDARERDPVAVIVWLSHQHRLWGRIAVQVYFGYNFTFVSAAELSEHASAAGAESRWRDHIMIIPVVAGAGIEQMQLPSDADPSWPSVFHTTRQHLVEAWLDSFDDAGLDVIGYVLAVRAEDKFVNREWDVDAHAVWSIVGRPLMETDKRPLQTDKILHNLIARQRARYKGKRTILVTSTTPTTSFRNTHMIMPWKGRDSYVFRSDNDMESWLIRSQAVVGSGWRHGGDGGTTDRWMHEISALAHEVQGTTPPREVTAAAYLPFSQEEYRRLTRRAL